MKIEDLISTDLEIIKNRHGDVYHGMKETDPGFTRFGEAYFSSIKHNSVKAWKKHLEMTMNFIVPLGKIGVVIFDDRHNSKTNGVFNSYILSPDNYIRLTIPPRLWVGFKGLSNTDSFLLNLADITHNPNEVVNKDINEIEFNWSELR
jgi:dTDP-4-dehydrorhamnose 3,5-epimerase and related enzymes|tara:strand:- start:42 stop:485 length:444 start_codon:yes stop_codon:yes gene_type:complete